MLTSAAVSLIMSDMQGIFLESLKQVGYSYPTLYLMNEESTIRIDDLMSKYECITDIAYAENQYGANVTKVTLRNRDEADDKAIAMAILEITHQHKPDALGYIAQCLYKIVSNKDRKSATTDSLNVDPDTSRVIHNCFFINGDDSAGYLMVTPYKTQEIKGTPGGKGDIQEFVFEVNMPYSVTVFNKGWEPASAYLETRIQNPYLL